MSSLLKKLARKFAKLVAAAMPVPSENEADRLALGKLLSNQQHGMTSRNVRDYEFKIFSQFGDDGVIQYLIKHIYISNTTFIEFGVEDYIESNTRFLMMNNNWNGHILDASERGMQSLLKQEWYWKYDLTQKAAFITKDNINELLAETEFSDIGLLSIDLDGNDYFILEALDFSKLNPAILIVEYNSIFGKDRAIAVPYQANFDRSAAHYSNLYFGASLPALSKAAEEKGYSLVGCLSAGNNAYFVRNDLLGERIRPASLSDAFVESRFRESRHPDGSLSYRRAKDRYNQIKGLAVLNVETGALEPL